MNLKYINWIKNYISRYDGMVRSRCAHASQEMFKSFPELQVVRGRVSLIDGEEEHVWCVDKDGEIIDPTACQYPIILKYRAFEPGDLVHVGTCMNCGKSIKAHVQSLDDKEFELADDALSTYVCSDKCQKALEDYYS